MQLGTIGLGRMGGNIVRRLIAHGHQAVVYDRSDATVAGLASEGATGASSLADLVSRLAAPRAVASRASSMWVVTPTLRANSPHFAQPAISTSSLER